MIRSMTGFGTAQSASNGWVLSVECRSVNHKGFDSRVQVPRGLTWLEVAATEMLRERIQRGRVDVRVELSRENGARSRNVDPARFKQVAEELKLLSDAMGLATVTVAEVLSFRDVIVVEEVGELDESTGKDTLRAALDALISSRQEEGERLIPTMVRLIESIEAELDGIESLRDGVLGEYQRRLLQRVNEALERFSVDLDASRVAQEVILYADRSDVAEEMQRARSHCLKLRNLLAEADTEPCGKRLDFYLQELMREVNTTGSKSSNVAITDAVVRMKSAVEQLREQSSNIE